ncbi:recombination-associated protein RdgC [Methylobacillus sp. Pita2]|uniref:recombination-associated protein RdgC n=1 Tax=Methylobacillus sp. Pita2 TaxID=3383245 RepID=UPI0038B68992
MIKNFIAIKLSSILTASMVNELNDALENKHFVPCGANDEFAFGFLPHPDSEKYLRTITHLHVINFVFEKKSVPAKLINTTVEEMLLEYKERSNGRDPSKEEIKEMKVLAKAKLLPRAFPKRTDVMMWIDNKTGLIFIEASSVKTAEVAMASLRNAYSSLPAGTFLNTLTTPSALMTKWILDQDIQNFTVDDRCEMVLPVDRKPTIKYVNHTLSGEEIKDFITDGRTVVSLGLTYQDKVSFQFTDKFIFKSIKYGEFLSRQFAEDGTDWAGQFLVLSADLAAMLDSLILHMGGLLSQQAEDALGGDQGGGEQGNGNEDDTEFKDAA